MNSKSEDFSKPLIHPREKSLDELYIVFLFINPIFKFLPSPVARTTLHMYRGPSTAVPWGQLSGFFEVQNRVLKRHKFPVFVWCLTWVLSWRWIPSRTEYRQESIFSSGSLVELSTISHLLNPISPFKENTKS